MSTNAGPHNSNLANKVDPRVDSDRDHRGNPGTSMPGSGPASNTAGPHSSNLVNQADPRVDSDLDRRGHAGVGQTGHTGAGYGAAGTGVGHTGPGVGHTGPGVGHTGPGVGHTGTTGHTGAGVGTAGHGVGHTGHAGVGHGGTGPAPGTAGPHSSNIANKADPNVDSDLDGRGLHQGGATGAHAGNYSGAHAGTHGGTHGIGSGPAPNTAGPHSSDMLNKADPRVDSDRDGRGIHSSGTGTHGAPSTHSSTSHSTTYGSGTGPAPNTAGPHSSDLLNKADPRVNAELDRRGPGQGTNTTGHNTGTTGHGVGAGVAAGHGPHSTSTGPAPHTAGPHKSDVLNKLDPRVDSDLDGSQTIGGNKGH